MKPKTFWLEALTLLLAVASCCAAQSLPQTPSSPQSPARVEQQTPIRVLTEEVIVPIVAYDERFRFDPTLEMQDLLLLEDGTPQEIKSLRRIPASVLLLLDTAGELNPVMKTNLTRDVALRLVSQLRAGDSVAAIQFGGRVDSIQGWTTDRKAVAPTLKTKLFSGKGARLAQVLNAASEQLREVPMGSRHVVLITDGTDSSGDRAALTQAVKSLLAVQATVHVISYTVWGRKDLDRLHSKYLVSIRAEKRKSIQDIADEILPTESSLNEKLGRTVYLEIENDFRLWWLKRKYRNSLKKNEEWLTALARESGGLILLPKSTEEIIRQADEVARDIDSQYVVSYKPKRSIASATKEEYRRIEVASRRAGLQLRTRRGYVVGNGPDN